jgi:hypothetical protein
MKNDSGCFQTFNIKGLDKIHNNAQESNMHGLQSAGASTI